MNGVISPEGELMRFDRCLQLAAIRDEHWVQSSYGHV